MKLRPLRPLRPLLLLAATVVSTGTAGSLAAPPAVQAPSRTAGPANGQEEFFETKVRPVLARRCGSCHSAERASAGLSLASRAALLKGGGRGPAVVPGKPEESLLLRAVEYADPTLKMPPAGKLPEAEIEALRQWIQSGAPWPGSGQPPLTPPTLGGQGGAAPGRQSHWAFQPLRRPAVPHPKDRAFAAKWVRTPIDAFILAKLEARGMRPAPEASPRELIRRVTFDLTGLPPTPEEVDQFVAESESERPKLSPRTDKSGHIRTSVTSPTPNTLHPTPYTRLVDRLLASPRYGERWARYWLDLVRYADSNGYERDAEKPYSWKYRDYVIRSLNADKPYDRFVVEQLAGDELPDRSEETVTATGFLRLGTWDDEPNDPLEYQYERLDDLVHTTTTAFLGLTVRCARCHDHKFDPIPQKDYYAVGAAFWAGYLQPGDGKLMGGPPPERLKFPVLGFTDRGREAPALHLLQNGDPRREGPTVEPGFLSLLPGPPRAAAPPPPAADTTHRRLQLARWIVDPKNPLTPRVIVNRIWQHHFGQGIVRTPNNFGRKGSLPTHPELLDWLAYSFTQPAASVGNDRETERLGDRGTGLTGTASSIGNDGEKERRSDRGTGGSIGRSISPSLNRSIVIDKPDPAASTNRSIPLSLPPSIVKDQNGLAWSLKRLHRLIMLSSTYRMGSVHPQEAAYSARDFANESWWRFNRRRLDADALRDAMLAVSGQLNLKEGGRGFTPAVSREALEGLSRKGAEWAVSPPEEQNRRSVYMFLKRALLMPFLTVFDFADTTQPLEQRESSVVATQALALMNNRFSHEQSDALAARIRREAGDDPGRQVDRLWRLAFGRVPDPGERSAALRHLRQIEARPSPPLPAPAESRAPDSLPALRLWLRADRGVRLDGDGRVLGWSDGSALHHDAAQEAAGARPEWVREGLNGQPALRFDGKGRFLALQGQPITSPAFTILALVTDRSPNEGPREIFSNWTRERNVTTSVFLGTTGRGTVRFTDQFAPAGTLTSPERPHVLTAVTGPSGSAVYQDRRLLADRPSPLDGRKLEPPYVVGQQGNIAGESWNGDLAELIVYDRALSSPELEGLWAYLGARYGVAPRPVPPAPVDRALASLCHAVLNANEFLFID